MLLLGCRNNSPALALVEQNAVDPIYLGGEVVVGAGILESVNLLQIPGTEYSYSSTHDAKVIVNEDRSVVRIIRD